MKQHQGFWFPDHDNHCLKVTISQAPDMDRAIKFCSKTDCVIQAGGNVGVWASRLSEIFREVYTFEPSTENFLCLTRNCRKENIHWKFAALGAQEGKASIEQVTGNCGANFIVDGNGADVLTIDSLDLEPDLIILDVEGYEEFAIHGGLETIKKYKPVLMYEDKDLSKKYTGHGKGYIEKWLEEYGYEVADRVHRDVILHCP